MSDHRNTIAFQGGQGAYSELACHNAYPDMEVLPCRAFEDTFRAVEEGRAHLAMIPIENSVAGRIADIHHLLPDSNLHIVGEHFQRVDHHLLGIEGATIDGLSHVHSQIYALNQCRNVIRDLGLEQVEYADTAGAAQMVAKSADKTQAAIASELAGEAYGLQSLRANIEDAEHNTTRFLIMAHEAVIPEPGPDPVVTSFIFRVKNIPAALFKSLGGFATNGVNMTKLESYLAGGDFQAAQFYADVQGHPEDTSLKRALEELRFFSREVKILGVYPAHPFRLTNGNGS